MLLTYLLEKLHDRSTYIVALVVGTFINGYGHLLVPLMRGQPRPFDAMLVELEAHPALVTSSLALGYCFPLIVGVTSSVITRYRTRHYEQRAWFPDTKPDPVFRCGSDGTITDSGTRTRELLARNQITNAAQLVGDELWRTIIAAHERRTSLAGDTVVHCNGIEGSYLLSHAPAPNGEVQIYLARTPDGMATR